MPEPRSTDPTGRVFVSYRRERLPDEIEPLILALHELGVPTWQDLEDLDEVHTETELRAVLRDPAVAGAVLWLTPGVADSPPIRDTEAPEAIARARSDEGFFVVPVAAGGLGYDDAAALVNDRLGVADLSSWNLLRLKQDPASPEEIRQVARRVLRRRIRVVHRRLPEGEPLRLRLSTRRPAGFQAGWALSLDWSHRFAFRRAHGDAWQESLLPALATVREAIRSRAPRRAVEACGSATLSSGLALGRAISTLDRDIRLTWRQEAPDHPDQLWSHQAPPEETPLQVTREPVRADGEALAVLLSVTADVEPSFSKIKADLPPLRCAVHVRPPGRPFQPFRIENPGQAVEIAERTRQEIRRAREEFRPSSIHLFGAIPLGLAVLLGQSLNTLGPIQTYEHDKESSRYTPELLLPEDL